MKLPSSYSSGSCRHKYGKMYSWGLSVVLLILLTTLPVTAFAQVCNAFASVGFGDTTVQPIILEDTYEARIDIIAGQITTDLGPAGQVGISVVRYEMDCLGAGGLFCAPDTNTVTYQGSLAANGVTDTDCTDELDSPITFTAALAGKQLVLTASDTIVLDGILAPGFGETCFVDILLSIDALGPPNTSVVQAGGYSNADPPTDAFCDTDDDGGFGDPGDIASGAQNTLTITPIICEVELDKYVCVDLDDDGVAETCFGEGEPGGAGANLEGKLVEFYIDYENTGTGTLDGCVIDDTVFGENVVPGGFSLLPGEGGTGVLISPDGLSCDVDIDNTATITCASCAVQAAEQPYVASDNASVECLTCEVEIDKQVACEFPPEPGDWVDITGVDDVNDPRETLGCTGWTDDNEISFRYDVTNLGELDVAGCFVTDTAVGFGFPGRPVELSVAGTFDTFDEEQLLCAPPTEGVEGESTGFLNCECIPFIDGVPLEQALGLSGPIDAFGEDCDASDADSVDVDCLTAGVSVSKSCGLEDVLGNWNVEIAVTNTFEADLETCALVDMLDGADVTASLICDGDPLDFNLPSGGAFNCTGVYPAGDAQVLNQVDVVCDIVGSKKFVESSDEDLCTPTGDGCFTRTPGYWGTHPESTLWALDGGLVNCGVLIDNVDGAKNGAPGSAIEDMCSIGKDHKKVQTTNTQLNLERHCMAAMLNISATTLQEGGTCESEYPGISQGLALCCGAGLEEGEESICNTDNADNKAFVSDCIGLVGGFNELNDGNALDLMDLCPDNEFTGFESPCSADSSVCRVSKGNGFVNGPRDREEVCHGKNCP